MARRVHEEDQFWKPLYSRFIKANDFKGVPHPLSRDYTPKPQEEIDESLYVYGKKGPQEPEPSISDDRSSEYSTLPSEVYVSTPITTTEKGMSAPKSKEVEPCSVSHIKTPRKPIKDQATPKVNRKNWNAMMERELGEDLDSQYLPGHQTVLVLKDHREIGDLLLRPQQDHPLKNMVDRGIFDSGCSGHMTGNNDQLEDFEEFNRGYVTFGGSKGYITGKGKIRVGTSEVTNSAGTSQTPNAIASEEKDEDVELIVVPSAVKNTEEKRSRRNCPKAFGTVSERHSTSTPSVNTVVRTVNTGRLDPDDSPMPELEIFHNSKTGIFDEASYDEEGVITDFNSLPTKIEVSPTPTLSFTIIHPKTRYLVILTQLCKLEAKLLQVWISVDLPHGMKVIGKKWLYRNKRDERGVNRSYQMKRYVHILLVLDDPDHPKKVYKVVKALYGLHQAPRAWYAMTRQ
ncbi:hypothetical protein Tco_0400298 [Tanacetum coccineum]